jgi:diguanylate cyclase (GGDEF)-like protein/PAS domain S-box-containing protein
MTDVETAKEQLRFTQELLDALPRPVSRRDPAGRFVAWNRAFLDSTGLDPDRLAGSEREGFVREDRTPLACPDPAGPVGTAPGLPEDWRGDEERWRSGLLFRSVFQESPFGTVLLSLDGSILEVNEAFRTLFGAPGESSVGRKLAEFAHHSDPPPGGGKTFPDTTLESAPPERRLVGPSGCARWVRSARLLVHGLQGRPLVVLEMFVDVTERREWGGRFRVFEEEYLSLFGDAGDGLLFRGLSGRLLEANVAARERLARSKEELPAPPRIGPEAPEGAGSFEGRRERLLADEKRSEERNVFLATHDDLTGLPNRSLFEDRLAHAISAGVRRKDKLAVLFLDLDDFKVVNDTFGHAVGDALLKQVGVRVTEAVRDGDTVARIGGDEFTVLVEEAGGDELVSLTRRILEGLLAPFDLDGHEISISTSIGIAVFPDDGRDIPTLLRCADTAMYRAKKEGKNTHHFYSTSMNARAVERISLETGLRTALERGEMSLAYQPQVSLATGRLSGAEALLRWRHGVMGPVSPAKFIPVAEDSGLIAPLTAWVLETVCIQSIGLAASCPGFPGVSVNVAPNHFRRSDVQTLVTRTLERTGANPRHLTLELAESALVDDLERTTKALQAIRALGVRISLDEYRIGYSSLALLRRLPIDELKINNIFTVDLTRSPEARAVVQAILSLARSLGMNTVAEGVETEEQRALLADMGCRSAQGFLVGSPGAAEGLLAFPPPMAAAAALPRSPC